MKTSGNVNSACGSPPWETQNRENTFQCTKHRQYSFSCSQLFSSSSALQGQDLGCIDKRMTLQRKEPEKADNLHIPYPTSIFTPRDANHFKLFIVAGTVRRILQGTENYSSWAMPMSTSFDEGGLVFIC